MFYILFVIVICLLWTIMWILRKNHGKLYNWSIIMTFTSICILWCATLLSVYNREYKKEVLDASPKLVCSIVDPISTMELLVKTEPIVIPEPVELATTMAQVYIQEDVPELIPERYAFTDDDIYIMARLLCGSKYKDGDGEYDFDYGNDDQYEQISLVLCVVMNRVFAENFPDTVEGVIMHRYSGQSYQFSPVNKWSKTPVEVSDIAIQRVTEWCEAYNQGEQTIPADHLFFSSNGKGINVSRPKL